MKRLLKRISRLTDQIEAGLYTKKEAAKKIQKLAIEIRNKFDPESEKFIVCIHPLK